MASCFGSTIRPTLDATICGWLPVRVNLASTGAIGRLLQLERARGYDSVILQRKLLPGWQLDHLRRRARRLVFDFDDAILYRDSYDPRGPHCPRRLRRFRRTVRSADVVLAGNDFLADCALRSGASPERVQVIPTCIQTDDYSTRRPTDRSPGIELAWIGSSSTLAGLEARRDLWERIGREVVGARLRLICDRFPDFGPLPIVPVEWSESTEAAELGRADVGISWLPDDLWSQGKCGLKVLQYQAVGLPVVTNPVGVHPSMVVDGVSGCLASTPDEWVDAIRTLRDDPMRRQSMGEAARRSVEEGYSVSAWSECFVAAVTGGIARRGLASRRVPTRATEKAARPVS